MIDRLWWLHVSDFHIVATGDDFSQRVAMEAMLKDVARRVDRHPVRFVLVTGDVAFSGRAQEYERARGFLMELASASGVPPNRFFFVPGNHDVDRRRHRLAWVGARTEITSQQAADRLLGNTEELSPLVGRQAEFWQFVRVFTGDQGRVQTADGLAYVANLVVEDLRLSVLGLNSPWLSGSDAEEMKLVVGERQVINALALARAWEPHLHIAMAHHPIGWLQEWDQVSCHQRLLAEVHLFHRGHLHMTEVSLTSSPARPCLSIAAGASHATRFYGNAYNVVELDLGAATCTIRPFTYDPAAARYEASLEVNAPIKIGGSLLGTTDDLARAISAGAPAAEPYNLYLAGLLHGEKEEIPVEVDGRVEFLRPSVAAAIPGIDASAALEFLRLRNLLPLYGENVLLSERVTKHRATIDAFSAYLSGLAAEDSRVAERLAGGKVASSATVREASRLPYAVEFLEQLRIEADWLILEIQARRLIANPDARLARIAKRALVEALMHSDEGEKREEAVRLAGELITGQGHGADDYLLVAAAHESAQDDSAAAAVMKAALALWPTDPGLRRYARQLALRTGDSTLRAAAERAVNEESQNER